MFLMKFVVCYVKKLNKTGKYKIEDARLPKKIYSVLWSEDRKVQENLEEELG
jgi:hypothetical protein